MATSDSEDFESADEDLDSTNKRTVDIKYDTFQSVENSTSKECTVISSNSSIVPELQSCEEKDEERQSTTSKKRVKEKQASKSDCKQKHGMKKLGTKLSNITENKITDEHYKSNIKISESPALNVEQLSDRSGESKVKSLKNTDAETICLDFKSKESLDSTHIDNESNKETSEDHNVAKSPSADGWDIEEEDGFEVPVSLNAKPKNEIIQSEREISPVLEKLSATVTQQESKGQSWGSWGNWGVSSLLSTATESVSVFSSHVTSGLSTVIETGLGVPDPEDLAKHISQEEKKQEADNVNKAADLPTTESKDSASTEGIGFSGLSSLVSGVGLLGTKVLSGGLDTLESLGKKTMEVLQEGDPMLRKKRAMLFHDPDKPVLSQILKEAKEKAESSDKAQIEKEEERKAHFETLFDDYQGLVHLEALEMLSKQCQIKLQTVLLSYSGSALIDLQETLAEVKELCELPEDEEEEKVLSKEDFERKVTECMKSLHPKLSPSKVIEVFGKIDNQLKALTTEKMSAEELNQTAISCMAEFTACVMECFHKGAELVLTKSHRSTADEAENFVTLTVTFCSQLSFVAAKFTALLTQWDPIANSSFITNIFLEAGNSGSYVQSANQLLLPVIQVGAAS